jgi:hypothetical protein
MKGDIKVKHLTVPMVEQLNTSLIKSLGSGIILWKYHLCH